MLVETHRTATTYPFKHARPPAYQLFIPTIFFSVVAVVGPIQNVSISLRYRMVPAISVTHNAFRVKRGDASKFIARRNEFRWKIYNPMLLNSAPKNGTKEK